MFAALYDRAARGMLGSMPLLMECTIGAPPEDADAITAGLVAFNRQASGQPASEPVTVIVRDPASREVRGGLRGKFTHAWLHVDQLWLADDLRGSGLGAEILGLAEEAAMRGRCVGVHLDTFDFQAPGFYERLGYEPFGVIEDHPPGHRRFYLQKRFVYPPC